MSDRFGKLAFLAFAFLMAAANSAASQSPEEFYKGKTIKMVVGYSAGGGNDLNARLLARFIGQFIPGSPRVIVENMPGASSLKSVQFLDSGATSDGTTIVVFSPGLVTESLTKPDRIPVKLTDYAWIGSLSQEVRVCYLRADLGIRTWQDLLKYDGVHFGETGVGSASSVDTNILRKIFGVKVKSIPGYPGGSEKIIAVERKELDGDCTSFSTVPKDWVESGKVNIVARGTTVSIAGIPDTTPYIVDLTDDPEKKKLIRFLLSPAFLGRPYITHKSIPADRLAAMREAFNAAAKDPQLLAEAAKLNLPIVGPLTGEEAASYVAELYKSSPEIVAAARSITE